MFLAHVLGSQNNCKMCASKCSTMELAGKVSEAVFWKALSLIVTDPV